MTFIIIIFVNFPLPFYTKQDNFIGTFAGKVVDSATNASKHVVNTAYSASNSVRNIVP
jgi:hypothetical protein